MSSTTRDEKSLTHPDTCAPPTQHNDAAAATEEAPVAPDPGPGRDDGPPPTFADEVTLHLTTDGGASESKVGEALHGEGSTEGIIQRLWVAFAWSKIAYASKGDTDEKVTQSHSQTHDTKRNRFLTGSVGEVPELDRYNARLFALDCGGNPKVVHGVVADDAASGHRVVAFRGSASFDDLKTDLKAFSSVAFANAAEAGGEGVTHSGFASAAAQFPVDNLVDFLQQPNTTLTITGHSLGGALATLVTKRLMCQPGANPGKWAADGRVTCITFGAPLVGDERFFESDIDTTVARPLYYHVVNKDDIVPRLAQIASALKDYTIAKFSDALERIVSSGCEDLKEKAKTVFTAAVDMSAARVISLTAVGLAASLFDAAKLVPDYAPHGAVVHLHPPTSPKSKPAIVVFKSRGLKPRCAAASLSDRGSLIIGGEATTDMETLFSPTWEQASTFAVQAHFLTSYRQSLRVQLHRVGAGEAGVPSVGLDDRTFIPYVDTSDVKAQFQPDDRVLGARSNDTARGTLWLTLTGRYLDCINTVSVGHEHARRTDITVLDSRAIRVPIHGLQKAQLKAIASAGRVKIGYNSAWFGARPTPRGGPAPAFAVSELREQRSDLERRDACEPASLLLAATYLRAFGKGSATTGDGAADLAAGAGAAASVDGVTAVAGAHAAVAGQSGRPSASLGACDEAYEHVKQLIADMPDLFDARRIPADGLALHVLAPPGSDVSPDTFIERTAASDLERLQRRELVVIARYLAELSARGVDPTRTEIEAYFDGHTTRPGHLAKVLESHLAVMNKRYAQTRAPLRARVPGWQQVAALVHDVEPRAGAAPGHDDDVKAPDGEPQAKHVPFHYFPTGNSANVAGSLGAVGDGAPMCALALDIDEAAGLASGLGHTNVERRTAMLLGAAASLQYLNLRFARSDIAWTEADLAVGERIDIKTAEGAGRVTAVLESAWETMSLRVRRLFLGAEALNKESKRVYDARLSDFVSNLGKTDGSTNAEEYVASLFPRDTADGMFADAQLYTALASSEADDTAAEAANVVFERHVAPLLRARARTIGHGVPKARVLQLIRYAHAIRATRASLFGRPLIVVSGLQSSGKSSFVIEVMANGDSGQREAFKRVFCPSGTDNTKYPTAMPLHRPERLVQRADGTEVTYGCDSYDVWVDLPALEDSSGVFGGVARQLGHVSAVMVIVVDIHEANTSGPTHLLTAIADGDRFPEKVVVVLSKVDELFTAELSTPGASSGSSPTRKGRRARSTVDQEQAQHERLKRAQAASLRAAAQAAAGAAATVVADNDGAAAGAGAAGHAVATAVKGLTEDERRAAAVTVNKIKHTVSVLRSATLATKSGCEIIPAVTCGEDMVVGYAGGTSSVGAVRDKINKYVYHQAKQLKESDEAEAKNFRDMCLVRSADDVAQDVTDFADQFWYTMTGPLDDAILHTDDTSD